jgi:hypothetical protein
MVILGQELAGFTVVSVLEMPAAADAYRAVDAEGHEITLYVQEDPVLSAEELQAEVERLMTLSRSMDVIVPVLGGGAFDGHGWIATPAGNETPLEDLLPGFRAGANERSLDVARLFELAAMLDGAHAADFAHGDLGPHTVAVTGQGDTVLRTFGFHRVFGEPTDPDASGARYRAPELFEGRRVDAGAARWSLGSGERGARQGARQGSRRAVPEDRRIRRGAAHVAPRAGSARDKCLSLEPRLCAGYREVGAGSRFS